MARASLFIVLIIVIAVSAELPRFRKQRENSKFLARQEKEPAATTERPAEIKAPYAAAGFRPGRAFNLPTEDEEAKAAEAPSQSFGLPANSYGPPDDSTTTKGFRPGRVFNLPTEDEEAKAAEAPSQSFGPPANSYGPPDDSTTTKGFRPGRAFNLPTEDEKTKAAEAPSQSYGPPANSYGPPDDSTTTDNPLDNDIEGNPKSEAEDLARSTAANEEPTSEAQPEFYYVQLPSGEIQKVAVLGGSGRSQALNLEPLVQPQQILLDPNTPQFSYVSQYTTW